MDEDTVFKSFGRRLGFIWVPSWAILGPSWGRLVAVLAHLGAILRSAGGVLGPSWGRPGAQKPRETRVFGYVDVLWIKIGILRDLVAILGHLGVSLGPSWSHLGPILGPYWGQLGASWTVLAPSWGQLGASWGHLGDVQVTQRKTTSRRSVFLFMSTRLAPR